MKPLLIILIFCPVLLLAQDQLAVEENVMPTLKKYTERHRKLMEAHEGIAAAQMNDSISSYMVDKTISGGYLKDRNGKVWNFGVLNEPYVLSR